MSVSYTHLVARPVDGREIAQCQEEAALLVLAEEGRAVALVVVGADPLEALPGEVQLPQFGVGQVELVGRLEEALELLVALLLQQVPVQRVLEVPLLSLIHI